MLRFLQRTKDKDKIHNANLFCFDFFTLNEVAKKLLSVWAALRSYFVKQDGQIMAGQLKHQEKGHAVTVGQ